MPVEHSGRLELTWTNKHLRLLATTTAATSGCRRPTTASPRCGCSTTPATTGETRADRSRAKDNLLIRGDALNALDEPLRAAGVRARVRRQGQARLPRPAVQHAAGVRALRRRAGALGLADDDARPAAPDPQAARVRRLGVGALRRHRAGVLQGDDGRGLRARRTSSPLLSGRRLTAGETMPRFLSTDHDYILVYRERTRTISLATGWTADAAQRSSSIQIPTMTIRGALGSRSLSDARTSVQNQMYEIVRPTRTAHSGLRRDAAGHRDHNA